MFSTEKSGSRPDLLTEALADKSGLETEGFRLGTCVFIFSELIAPTVHQAVVFMFMHSRITG